MSLFPWLNRFETYIGESSLDGSNIFLFRCVKITAKNKNDFIADPYLAMFSDKCFLLAEYWDSCLGRGCLLIAEICIRQFKIIRYKINDLGFHVSFPHRVYSSKGAVNLYTLESKAINQLIFFNIDQVNLTPDIKRLVTNISIIDPIVTDFECNSYIVNGVIAGVYEDSAVSVSCLISQGSIQKIRILDSIIGVRSRNAGTIAINGMPQKILKQDNRIRYGHRVVYDVADNPENYFKVYRDDNREIKFYRMHTLNIINNRFFAFDACNMGSRFHSDTTYLIK